MSSHRLNQLVHVRNIAFAVDDTVASTLLMAGADQALIQSLGTLPAPHAEMGAPVCPAGLAQAGALIRSKHYDEAERILRKLVTEEPRN
ncbi:MAG TPA: hypothetical protein VK555_04415, partial [Terriglobales bacterium]|nr:hypothetical protein [Terriglobales bacterium]